MTATLEERTTRRLSVFQRLAGWAYRRRWLALALWVVVLAGVTVGSQVLGNDYRNDFSLPGTESQRALDVLKRESPAQAGATVQIVMENGDGLNGDGTRARVEQMLAEVRGLPHVVAVTGPYVAVSPDGTVGYATVTLDGTAEEVPAPAVRELISTARAAEGDGLRVELSGDPVRNAEESEGGAAEGIGLLAALVILVLLFGSRLAASLPIVIAVCAVGTALGFTVLASHAATVADFTAPLMLLVGLGVGIDYALLVFSRYRSELVDGTPRDEAVTRALDTAGRTVFFAGCTVIVALLGLVLLGLGSLQGVAVAMALTVLMTMLAALTLLPALLALFGGRIERSVRRRAEKREARGRRPDGAGWRRLSDAVRRRRWSAVVVPTLAMVALAAPAVNLQLGFADAGNDAPGSTSRQAYDLLAKGFGPGYNGPLIVVVEGGDAAAARAAQEALGEADGVAAVVPQTGEGAGPITLVVLPDSKPQDPATGDLVNRLRSDVLPPVEAQTGATFLVGGSTAAVVDYSDAVASRLPLFVLVVVGVSMLLLLLVFRSVLVPIKAAVLNLLSVAAAMGVITLVFQEGMFGVAPGPIEAYVPVMIFAIVFGLSMDYEVFLLARMHEEWMRRGDASAAVREGLATTGKVVTAAAAIMIVVFGAFLFSPDRMLQQFGLGLAVAVLVDALVIRCLILPGVMHLLGTSAWWLPGRLARRLPRVALEHT
jgi:RND superfamily putative drug exporter